ncbi:MAG: hypothetical protein HW421_1058 [Ignavibacteria bacterium]|nr:hypothetical protein [Ignavibacteria bacterium]
MPEISRFFGIIITMNFNDHNPPHIHANYGDDEAVFDIQNNSLINGKLSKTATKLVKLWINLHKIELLENWDLLRNKQQPIKITPLD